MDRKAGTGTRLAAPAPATAPVAGRYLGRGVLLVVGAVVAGFMLAVPGCTAEEAEPPAPRVFPEPFHLNAFEAGFGYSQAVKVGKTLYVSGTMAVDAGGNLVAPGDMAGQLRAVYTNLQHTLAAHGATLDDIVLERIATTDMAAFLAASEVRFEFHPQNRLPAASFTEVRQLADAGFLVQVEAVAELP
jgi:enamine deaminase RidA (YjgF/YER057c/UK114 family)